MDLQMHVDIGYFKLQISRRKSLWPFLGQRKDSFHCGGGERGQRAGFTNTLVSLPLLHRASHRRLMGSCAQQSLSSSRSNAAALNGT